MGIHFREPTDFVQILEVTPATRHALENAIERLVALLDTLDPDPDLEPDTDDEPSLAGGSVGDDGRDRELDLCDDEPSLGWTSTEACSGDYPPQFECDLEHDASERLMVGEDA